MRSYVHVRKGPQGARRGCLSNLELENDGYGLPDMGARAVLFSTLSPLSSLLHQPFTQSQTVIFSSQAITGGEKALLFLTFTLFYLFKDIKTS